jgi:hypothetical protein
MRRQNKWENHIHWTVRLDKDLEGDESLTVDGGLISCIHTETIKKPAKDEQMVMLPRFESGYLRNVGLQQNQNSQLLHHKHNTTGSGTILRHALYIYIYIYIYIYTRIHRKIRVKIWSGLDLCIHNLQCDVSITAQKLIIDVTQHLRYSVVIIHFRIMKVQGSNLSLGNNQIYIIIIIIIISSSLQNFAIIIIIINGGHSTLLCLGFTSR